jgi:hypothetical protein
MMLPLTIYVQQMFHGNSQSNDDMHENTSYSANKHLPEADHREISWSVISKEIIAFKRDQQGESWLKNLPLHASVAILITYLSWS